MVSTNDSVQKLADACDFAYKTDCLKAAGLWGAHQDPRIKQRVDEWVYLQDVLTRLPAQPNRAIEELLPHRWLPLARESCTALSFV